jgi:hypothetical protein
MNNELPDPEKDGIDHINIFSRGKTELGRILSNLYAAWFEHPEDGWFRSIEAYWHYLKINHPQREELRATSGPKALRLGRDLRRTYGERKISEQEFQRKIRLALEAKSAQYSLIRDLLTESDLPFRHYYVYFSKTVVNGSHQWVVEIWEQIRKRLKEDSGERSLVV